VFRTGAGLRGGVIKINWRLDLETDKGTLDLSFRYDSDKKSLAVVLEPLDPDLVTEAVYEVIHWCETLLHKSPTVVEESDDRE